MIARLVSLIACHASDLAESPPDDTSDTSTPPLSSNAVFDPTVVHRYALELYPADWAEIRDDPWGVGNSYHHARFTYDDEVVLDDVGVRAFGYGSLGAGGTKPSLKIAFDHYVDGGSFADLEQLKLDNSAQDPTFLRERLGNAILRRWDVPAPRTGWASVSVNGEPVGFFVALEPVDDVFLDRWFATNDGPLWGTNQGAWGQGLMPMDDPFVYYGLETKAASDGAHLAAITQLIATGTNEEVVAAVDVSGFLKESIARSVMGSVDSLSSDANNFYLYEDATQLRVIPWDLDYDLGNAGLDVALGVDPKAPWLASPWASDTATGEPYTDVLLQRILAAGVDVDPMVSDLINGAMAPAVVDAELEASVALIRPEMDADPIGDPAGFDASVDLLRTFLSRRHAQLAAEPPPPCGEPPAPGELRAADLVIAGTVGWDQIRIDSSTLGPGFDVGGVHHCTGVFAHAPSLVQVTIPAGCTTIAGGGGLQEYGETCGDGVLFRVKQDGVTLWESAPVGNSEAALPFGPIAIAPGLVELEVDPRGDISCDTAAWVDLSVACAP